MRAVTFRYAIGISLVLVVMMQTVAFTQKLSASKDTINTQNGPFTTNNIWIHPKAQEITGLKMGPFVSLPDGGIVTIDTANCYISSDQGKSWTSYPIFRDSSKFFIRIERALIRTRKGTLILAFANDKERSALSWNNETHNAPEAFLPTYVVTSNDNGKTWNQPQLLHRDWTGAIRDIIETRDGRIVFSTMMMRYNPGHHTVLTYTSADEGKSWKRSNIIDLGGVGHHGGVTESTLEAMKDGSLKMFLRTNWGTLWETNSTDHGLTWTNFRSTPIPASSAPAMFKRLKSGRLILIWNPYFPQGKTTYPLRGGDLNWSETPVSNHREELAIMFSEDDGKTWSKPVVIAKTTLPRTQVSYPYFFERVPGEIWITTMFGELRVMFHEKDFIR